ncbi:hypothetical protein Dsin_005621 [Dipteronia sinensis]|uniref:Uncharacterized protein n=1 Tax=Dipteronia sinensis TaxID=43782 RepID=A0AAE0EF36_9ROSI|nr:hypothetical protein Dsin_005621 [Dipteronia sinensis]
MASDGFLAFKCKFAQALEIVASIPLDQSQYEWVQIGYLLQELSESGYATEVNQLIQKWEIQSAEAPPETGSSTETGSADSSV